MQHTSESPSLVRRNRVSSGACYTLLSHHPAMDTGLLLPWAVSDAAVNMVAQTREPDFLSEFFPPVPHLLLKHSTAHLASIILLKLLCWLVSDLRVVKYEENFSVLILLAFSTIFKQVDHAFPLARSGLSPSAGCCFFLPSPRTSR